MFDIFKMKIYYKVLVMVGYISSLVEFEKKKIFFEYLVVLCYRYRNCWF